MHTYTADNSKFRKLFSDEMHKFVSDTSSTAGTPP